MTNTTAQDLPARRDLDPNVTWNIEAIFPSPAAWDAEFEAVQADLPTLKRHAGKLGSPEGAAAYYRDAEALAVRVSRLSVYAGMAASVDANDTAATARRDRAANLSASLAANTAFAEPELLALPQGTLEAYAADERLADQAVQLRRLERRRPHVRSADVEEVLGLVRSPFAAARSVHPTLVNSDLDFGRAGGVKIGQGNIGRLLASPDRNVRREAWESYADAHLGARNAMAGSLLAGVRQNVFTARVRNYDDSLHAALAPHDLPVGVFHTLIDAYRRHVPTWHRYWAARSRWLGVERLREYDVFAPLSANPPAVPYAQSVEWIAQGMKPLGEAYGEVMRAGLTTERWVDIAPNAGKRQGAYSSGVQGTHPYIFMSYGEGGLGGMSTLAHEIGHSMHSYLAWQTQPWSTSGYSLFVAEVASNFNQAMVRQHLFETQTDEDFQLALIDEAMANFHRYFFIMPTLARFELEIHRRVERGESLTADGLNALMADLFTEGYGPSVDVDRDRTGITWAQFSTHLYSNFYVWQYATGIAAAHALLAGFDDDADGARERYLTFLRAGSSVPPLDVLRAAGVDMLQPDAVERAFEVLAGYVDRLEDLLEKRGR